MNTLLFCMPLKEGSLKQYQDFIKKTANEKAAEWKDMLFRYDISCVKVWDRNFEGKDYVFVYHEVGPTFEEKIKNWDNSSHPFDKWFNGQIMAAYDVKNVEAMESPHKLLELFA